MQYLNKSFSVSLGSDAYRANFDRIFKAKPKPKPKKAGKKKAEKGGK